jgi:hypothetical protein
VEGGRSRVYRQFFKSPLILTDPSDHENDEEAATEASQILSSRQVATFSDATGRTDSMSPD